ncbi:MAG: hypothetical protein G8D28_08935 [gamma proteobacterium symbiont of Phacoides pectinatus]
MTRHPMAHVAALLSLLLAGCSAPPAPGVWIAEPGGEADYSRLSVEYDGRAELFIPEQEAALLRCFWRAASAQGILLQCAYAERERQDVFYDFRIDPDGGATLSRDDRSLARFRRQPR